MDWRPTSQEPKFTGRWIRPKYGDGNMKANHQIRNLWVWLFHPDEGVRPYELEQIWYDNSDKPYINVLGQEDWSFIRWNWWAPLELPPQPKSNR